MTNQVANFFGESPQQSQSIMQRGEKREATEVQAMVLMAKSYPRNQIHALDRILNACGRPTLAQNALYAYARGGASVTGPSIRLAEAIAQQWGNIDYGIRELKQENGESTVEAYAWDLETNVRQTKVFQVPHWRHTKAGGYALKDPRDIYELVANNGARRLRACLLGVIPGDVIEAAVDQCHATQAASVDLTDEKIKQTVAAFEAIGVTAEMIGKRLQRKVESMQPAQYLQLRQIYASLKDGMSTPADWFDMPQAVAANDSNAALDAAMSKADKPKASANAYAEAKAGE